jgi:two-component system, OmpR family, phosphate regulon sensor histidine kinase PhoR
VPDIRWRTFWLLFTLALVCLIVWASSSSSTALVVLSTGLLLYLASHIYWIHRLSRWLGKPDIDDMPVGAGIWEDIFAAIYHQQRLYARNQTQLSSALDRFRHAASALPDGVTLLNKNDKIEWCNAPAEKQLGLNMRQDAGQPISYLLRHTDFTEYLKHGEYTEPIKLKSGRDSEITLELQLIPFGDKQKLMISRDISQLEKIEHMRRDFIANVSHELRTPLTVVGGFLETLSDMEGAVPPSTSAYFNMMQEQTHRMRLLIEDLLTLSQLESGTNMPQDTEVDVTALLHTLVKEANSLSHGRHQIILNSDANLALTGSMQELHSAFSNLVTNAVRYTPEGGEIELTWASRGNEAVFSVRDTGIGIEQKHLDRLTERFYRVDRSRSRETGGTGLGLSIVKHILTRHQARLEIESEFGKGSIFKMVFSKSRVVRKTATAV